MSAHGGAGRGGLAAALALAALLLAALAAERLWLIPVHVSFNPNEGWNAFQAARAMGSGGPLYPPPGALTGDNYPPLSFLLVGGLAALTGLDAIVAGRVVSVLAVLATAGAVAWAVRRLEPRPTWAPAAGAGVVLGFAATQFRAYLAMDDPQWLAHALMTPALALLLPERGEDEPRAGRVVAAATLVVLGGLVKHNLLALPVAATAWLALRRTSALAVWAGTGAALAAAAVAAIVAVYGSVAVTDVLSAARQGSWLRMVRSSAGPVLASAPLLVAAAGLVRLRRTDRRLDLPILFIAAALPWGVLQRAGQGVNFNAHFEALVALAVGGGAVLAHALADRPPPTPSPAAWRTAGWLALPFAVLVPLAAAAAWKEARSLPVERASWAALERRIAAAPGPTACETPALCFWAGRPFVLDFFLYGQRLAATRDASALGRALADGRIAAVERDPDRPRKPGDPGGPLPALLDARTRVVFVAADGRRFEVPRQ